jgi:hypothetical protein
MVLALVFLALKHGLPSCQRFPDSWTSPSRQVRHLLEDDCSSLTANLALPPPTSERAYDVLYAAIHSLNDDILLDIFNCYRLDDENGWNVRLGWCKLCHVCQRWRHLICKSASHLGLQIQCTNGTATVDTLDHLPTLPLLVDYTCTTSVPTTEKDESGIYEALKLHDRVRHIHLHLPPSILHKCLVLLDEHFPTLEYLSILFTTDNLTTLTLPNGFYAPNLRHLALPGISPPKRLRLLTPTVSLVTLSLSNIQSSSYIRPRLLVARLLSLPQLKKLSIGFSTPMPRPSAEQDLLGEPGTSVTLPNLKNLTFRGVGAYLESLVAQIRAPLLERLDVILFNQISFALPHLAHLINTTEGFKLPIARVLFHRNEVSILTSRQASRWSDGPCRIRVMCKQFDWQIDCAAQICSALIPALSGVPERFILECPTDPMLSGWRKIEIDYTTWIELLRPLVGVKELRFDNAVLLEELSHALQVDEVLGLDPGFLPDLQYIVAGNNRFASFIDTRRAAGRPVLFWPTSSRPPTLRPRTKSSAA